MKRGIWENGLVIARKIIERHHGKIEVESTLGQGSIFRVWLPKFEDEPVE